MKKIVIGLAVLLSACTDTNTANRVLQAQGFTKIEILGYSPFGCSEDDLYHTKFLAYSQSGQIVTGVVCSAPFKGATVRFW